MKNLTKFVMGGALVLSLTTGCERVQDVVSPPPPPVELDSLTADELTDILTTNVRNELLTTVIEDTLSAETNGDWENIVVNLESANNFGNLEITSDEVIEVVKNLPFPEIGEIREIDLRNGLLKLAVKLRIERNPLSLVVLEALIGLNSSNFNVGEIMDRVYTRDASNDEKWYLPDSRYQDIQKWIKDEYKSYSDED